MNTRTSKKRILFYCRCNALGSQMAEAFTKKFFPERYEAYSAGMLVRAVHPTAIRVMAEVGIDMSAHRSKSIEEFVGTKFDLVALVCGGPARVCPFFSGQEKSLECKECAACCVHLPLFPRTEQVLHTSFRDPTTCAEPDEESLDLFRKMRNEIRDWVIETLGADEVISLSMQTR